MRVTTLAGLTGLTDAHVAEVIAGLSRLDLTVACAESLTGGLLTALLTEVAGASAVVRGGLVVYATDLKQALAGVDAGLLAARGPVDPEVARALADGARSVCGAQLGVGLTGVAGPDRQNGIAVGTWYVAITGTTAEGRAVDMTVSHLPAADEPMAAFSSGLAGRSEIRNAAVRAAVGLLTELL